MEMTTEVTNPEQGKLYVLEGKDSPWPFWVWDKPGHGEGDCLAILGQGSLVMYIGLSAKKNYCQIIHGELCGWIRLDLVRFARYEPKKRKAKVAL